MSKGELNICRSSRIKDAIERHNIKIVSLLCILILILSLLSIQDTVYAILASISSVAVVFVQSYRRDSYSWEFSKNDWIKVTDDDGRSDAVLQLNLADGFQTSPFVVFKKYEDSYKEVVVQKEYSLDGMQITLTINSYEFRFDGIVIIGGPLRSGWKR